MNTINLDVTWELGPTMVYGTLVKPEGSGPFPGVIMVAGSGPTDRNWNSPLLPGTNGSAALIAQALAEAGIASLRYDKRTAGKKAPTNMPHLMGKLSMLSYAEEVAGGMELLSHRQDIRVDQIFGFGHSEGTLHILHYQLKDPVYPLAGMVLAGPPGRAVGSVARSQIAAQASTLPHRDDLMAQYDASITRFLGGEAVAPNPMLPEGIQHFLLSLEAPANLPFTRELWIADTSSLLRNADVPLLVVIGKKDIQVDWTEDGELLQHAVKEHEDAILLFPDNANHVLKYEPNPRARLTPAEAMQRYNAQDADLDPETMSSMLTWLFAHMV